MTNILIILAALHGIHGTQKQCTTIVRLLADEAVDDAIHKPGPIHIDEDLVAIKKWYTNCFKPGKIK